MTPDHDASLALAALQRHAFPGTPIAGASTARGVLSDTGFAGGPYGYAPGLGLWGIRDAKGRFGVGLSEAERVTTAAAAAVRDAWNHSDTWPNPPKLVWLITAPGEMEHAANAVRDVVGPSTVLAGCCASDNSAMSDTSWYMICSDGGVARSGAVAVVMHTSVGVHAHLSSPFHGTHHSAQVTDVSSDGLVVFELGGYKAEELYDQWGGGGLTRAANERDGGRKDRGALDHLAGSNVLFNCSLQPLLVSTTAPGSSFADKADEWGSRSSDPDASQDNGIIMVKSVGEDGGLRLTHPVCQGDTLTLCGAQRGRLHFATSTLHHDVTHRSGFGGRIVGALGAFSAVVATAMSENVGAAAREVVRELRGQPFLYTLSFEQLATKSNEPKALGSGCVATVVFGVPLFGSPAPADVFLSYPPCRSQDEAHGPIVLLRESLHTEGLRVWMDISRTRDDTATRECMLGVAMSTTLLCCVTRDTVASRQCADELREASKRGVPIIPVLMPGFKMPAPPRAWNPDSMPVLAGLHFFDFRTADSRMRNWPGLVQCLQAHRNRGVISHGPQ